MKTSVYAAMNPAGAACWSDEEKEEGEDGDGAGSEAESEKSSLDPAKDEEFRLRVAGSVLFSELGEMGEGELEELGEGALDAYIPEPPDGGWGWVVVAASFMANLVVDGIAYSFGMFMPEFQAHFGCSQGAAAIVGSLLAGTYLLVGPAVSGLVNVAGAKAVMMAGSVVGCGAFLVAVYSPSIVVLMLLYGVGGGLGFGLIYLPAIVHVGQYFEKKRAFATGLAVSGSGVGTFVFAPLSVALIDGFGWQGALWIQAGLVLNCAVFGALLRPLEPKADPQVLQAKLDREQAKLRSALSQPGGFGSLLSIDSIRAYRQRRISDASGMPSRSASRAQSGQDLRDAGTRSRKTSETNDELPPSAIGAPQLAALPEGEILDQEKAEEEETALAQTQESVGKSSMNIHDQDSATSTKKRQRNTLSMSSNVSEQSLVMSPRHARRQFLQPRMSAASYASSISRLSVAPGGPMAAESLLSLASVKAEDFARPLYRQDIFYSGSLSHLPQYAVREKEGGRGEGGRDYRASTLTIPQPLSETDGVLRALGAEAEEEEGWEREACAWLPRPLRHVLLEMMGLGLLRNPVMALLCLSNVLGMLGFYCPFVFLSAKAVEQAGVSKSSAAFLLSVIGMTNTLGRIFFGWLADRRWVSALLINNVCLAASAVLTLVLAALRSYAALVAYSAAFGFCVSAYISLTSIVLVDHLGLEALSNSFGLLILARGVACVLGSPLGGLVYDATQSLDAALLYSGAMLALAAAVSFCIHLLPRCVSQEALFVPDDEEADDALHLDRLPSFDRIVEE